MKGPSAQMALRTSNSRLRQPRICTQCAFRLSNKQCRPFSASAASRATMGAERMPSGMMDRLAAQQGGFRSQKAQLKEMKAHQIPTDIGLVGQAKLFPPFRKSLPLLIKHPLKFFKLIFVRGQHSVAGVASLWTTLRGNRRRDKLTGKYEKREKFRLKERPRIASDLHKRLNTAIPTNGSDTIKEIACAGLEQKVKMRQQYRKQARLPQEYWGLVRYNGINPPKWMPWFLTKLIPFKAVTVIRDYAYPLPWSKNSYVRQIVVRIRSRQAYNNGDDKGMRQKDLTEHIVIQRMVLEGQPKEWMIWGTVEPKSIEDIDELINPEEDKKDLSWTEKMKMLFGGSGAGMPTNM